MCFLNKIFHFHNLKAPRTSSWCLSLCCSQSPSLFTAACHLNKAVEQTEWINSAALLLCVKTSSKTRRVGIITLEWFSGSSQPYCLRIRTKKRPTEERHLMWNWQQRRKKQPGPLTSWDSSVPAKDQWLLARQTKSDPRLNSNFVCVCCCGHWIRTMIDWDWKVRYQGIGYNNYKSALMLPPARVFSFDHIF